MYYYCVFLFCFFFFKQKTAYEVRISDWSSDVCSSDLGRREWLADAQRERLRKQRIRDPVIDEVRGVATHDPCLIAAFDRRRDLEQIGSASCRARVCPYV